MNNVEKMRSILVALGVPEKEQNDLCCYVLLVMGKIYPQSKAPQNKWENATNEWIRIHDMMSFINIFYRETPYAENTRETVRKNALHHFRTAAFVEDNGQATNSPNYRYRLTNEFLDVLKNEGAEDSIKKFLKKHESLKQIYSLKKDRLKQPVEINGKMFSLSPGKHNQLQKAIVENFRGFFAPKSKCLYVGDTTEKDLVKDVDCLQHLGFAITLHDKMPDVVLYDEEKDWLFFVEAVTSVGPMDPKRITELNALTKNVKSGKVFVTAFLDFATYKKFSADLAWDTEVWIADMPEHMIHLNGDKFLGPRG